MKNNYRLCLFWKLKNKNLIITKVSEANSFSSIALTMDAFVNQQTSATISFVLSTPVTQTGYGAQIVLPPQVRLNAGSSYQITGVGNCSSSAPVISTDAKTLTINPGNLFRSNSNQGYSQATCSLIISNLVAPPSVVATGSFQLTILHLGANLVDAQSAGLTMTPKKQTLIFWNLTLDNTVVNQYSRAVIFFSPRNPLTQTGWVRSKSPPPSLSYSK